MLSTTSSEAAVQRASGAVLLAAARANLSQDRLEAAIDLGRQALAAGGGAEARLVIGGALMKLRRTREAELEFASAAAEDPRHPLVRRRLEQARERLQAEASAVAPPPREPQRPARP